MRRELLSAGEIDSALVDLPDWAFEESAIHADFDCGTFAGAIAFVVQVGFIAEALDHHPDIEIRWKVVHLAVTTHDRGGLTEFDLALARRVSALREN